LRAISEQAKLINFAGFEIGLQAQAWNRGFRGSNFADFWVRPSHMSIMLDSLLKTISET
jgi:hypothetical protein